MKYYLRLQIQRLFRWLKNIGFYPVIALIIGLVVFIVFSKLMFYKLDLAKWFYPLPALALLFKLSSSKRNDQLKNIFERSSYIPLRILENGLVIFPFLAYLFYEGAFLVALAMIPIAMILSFYTNGSTWNKTIITPFKKFPFEFIVGFRKTFWVIAIAYFLMAKGVQVDNYNLSLFGLAVIFLCSMSYFQKAEDEYFVWIYSDGSKDFLIKKLLVSIACVTILAVVGLLILLIGFPMNWLITIGVYIFGCIFLGSMVVVKYSAFPHEINAPQIILYAFSLIFPPILLFTIWIFYAQSKKRLEPILG